MRFTKMEGLGNDYIYLSCLEGMPERPEELSRRLSDRHFGVGGDGIICIGPGREGDFSMEMFNADGSRGAMCGNGIRCLGKYVYDKRLTRKTCLAIDTPAGVRRLELHLKGGLVEGVTVEMGEPKVGVPLELETGEGRRAVIPVDMGNPHGVILTQQPQAFPLERVGPLLQADPAFPQGVNVEAAAPVPEGLELRVWERGSGETLACGTGACAAFAALVKRGLCPRSARARLPGGWLELSWPETGAGIRMTGPARTVFEGEIPD